MSHDFVRGQSVLKPVSATGARYRQARNSTLMCTKLPDSVHYMIRPRPLGLLADMRLFGTNHYPKCQIPKLSVIHLATETGNCA